MKLTRYGKCQYPDCGIYTKETKTFPVAVDLFKQSQPIEITGETSKYIKRWRATKLYCSAHAGLPL